MSPRLTKELRPLLLPWALATMAAVGHLVVHPDSAYFHGAFGDLITGLAGSAFVVGVLVLAAMPMGSELHEHTLTLLFSQPVERARLWKEKLFAASVMIASLTVVHALATVAMGRLNLPLALLGVAFAITAISSVGYHTLATGSILVGIATAIGMPYAVTLCTYLTVHYLFGFELHLSEREMQVLLIVATLAYSAFCLWLSRRQFANLELRHAIATRAAEVPAALVPSALSNLFRPRPTGVILNLIRKEVCLHKPIFLVTAIFTAAWLLTLLVMLLRPEWHDHCVATFHGLTGTQVLLMVILGGCTALGDDKALGTSYFHLTLPVSRSRQWFVKLATAFGTTIAVAVVLPTLLAIITLFKARVGLLAIPTGEGLDLALPCLLVFVLSFWSASMATNTVRAALTCVLASAGACAMAGLGMSLPEALTSPLQSNLIAWVLAQFQVNPGLLGPNPLGIEHSAQHPGMTAYPILIVLLVCTFTPLAQSFAVFRRGQPSVSLRIKYAIILAAIIFISSFWYADLGRALPAVKRHFDAEVGSAWVTLPHREQLKIKDAWPVSPQELEKTGALTPVTARWLKDSKIRITRIGVASSTSPAEAFLISVTFPGSQTYVLGYVHYVPQH